MRLILLLGPVKKIQTWFPVLWLLNFRPNSQGMVSNLGLITKTESSLTSPAVMLPLCQGEVYATVPAVRNGRVVCPLARLQFFTKLQNLQLWPANVLAWIGANMLNKPQMPQLTYSDSLAYKFTKVELSYTGRRNQNNTGLTLISAKDCEPQILFFFEKNFLSSFLLLHYHSDFSFSPTLFFSSF